MVCRTSMSFVPQDKLLLYNNNITNAGIIKK